jgi:hypothetical protein
MLLGVLGQIVGVLYFVGLFFLITSKSTLLIVTLTTILIVLPGIGCLVFALTGRSKHHAHGDYSWFGNFLGTVGFILLGLMLLGLATIVLLRKLQDHLQP